jgi:hypothetical protein
MVLTLKNQSPKNQCAYEDETLNIFYQRDGVKLMKLPFCFIDFQGVTGRIFDRTLPV